MMRRTAMTLASAGLLLAGVGTLAATQLKAQADPLQAGEPLAQVGDRGNRRERFIEGLDLTDEQVTQLREIKDAAREEMRALKEQIQAERATMRTLMAGSAPEAELRAQHATLQDLHMEAGNRKFETMLAIRAVLTPEQRAEMADLLEDHRGKGGGFRGRRGFQKGQGPRF